MQTLLSAARSLQSSGLPDLSGSGEHSYRHYRIGKDVVLRLEYINPQETKVRHMCARQACTLMRSSAFALTHLLILCCWIHLAKPQHIGSMLSVLTRCSTFAIQSAGSVKECPVSCRRP